MFLVLTRTNTVKMNKNYTTATLPKELLDQLRARYPNMSITQILSQLAELQAEGSKPSGPANKEGLMEC